MDLGVEFQCKMALISEGVPLGLGQRWYEAIYLKPDLSTMEDEFWPRMGKVSDGDIMDLLTLYGEEGSESALKAMIMYYSRLYGIDWKMPIVENDAIESVACLATFKNAVLTNLCVAVNPRAYTFLDGAALLAVMAHEMWHAWQLSSMDRWVRELCGARLDFDVDPSSVKRQLLYYLNYQKYVSMRESGELYGSQVVEQEAYYASSAMLERIRMFSTKVFERAYRSMSGLASMCLDVR